MSEKVEIFEIVEVLPVEGFDNLGAVQFYGYSSLVQKKDFKAGELAAFIPPDFIVPELPEYAFLKGKRRIRAMKLRGFVSQGLVVAAPKGSRIGDDVTAQMGIVKYVPKMEASAYSTPGKSNKWLKYRDFIADPPNPGPYYDIESYYRHSSALVPDETVVVTEKIHGMNARYTWQAGKLWAASRAGYRWSYRNTPWWSKVAVRLGWAKRPTVETEVWKAVDQNPWITDLCRNNPGLVFYGEIYGAGIQSLTYGAAPGEIRLRLFDIFDPEARTFLDYIDDMWAVIEGRQQVAVLYSGPFDQSVIDTYISGPSETYWNPKVGFDTYNSDFQTGTHLREGIVIRPVKERLHHGLGRVILKAVSPQYLESQEGKVT